MPKVTAFKLPGMDLWFYSDEHAPPHLHAEKPGEWELRVFFLRHPDGMVEVVYSNKP